MPGVDFMGGASGKFLGVKLFSEKFRGSNFLSDVLTRHACRTCETDDYAQALNRYSDTII